MLTEQEIQQALGASYVVPLNVPNPHGPFGWEHVAQAVADVFASRKSTMIVQPLEFSRATWEKLEQLAKNASKAAERPVSVAEFAEALLEHVVGTSSNR